MKPPRRGDIIHLTFDPASGRELKGDHFGLVVSPDKFNASLGLAFICPISQGLAGVARENSFLVSLMGTGCATQGSVHVHQCKSLDFNARKAVVKERVPPVVMSDVLQRLSVLFEE